MEREEDWQKLRQGVFDFFELEEPLLESMGDRVAMLVWRLYRVSRFETEAIRQYLDDVPGDWHASLRLEGRAAPNAPTKADVEEMNRCHAWLRRSTGYRRKRRSVFKRVSRPC